jgi:hypothetical protein
MVTMSAILADAPKLSVEESEWEKAERKFIGSDGKEIEDIKSYEGKEDYSMVWDDSKLEDKEVELEDKTIEYLQSEIDKKDKAGELTLKDKALISLQEKIK